MVAKLDITNVEWQTARCVQEVLGYVVVHLTRIHWVQNGMLQKTADMQQTFI